MTILDLIFERSIPVPESGCWLWLGSASKDGYGRFRLDGMPVRASRAAWQAKNGPIPDGLLVCHKCDTPRCVNPDHLFLGTIRENALDAVRKGRHLYGAKNYMAKLTDDDVRTIRAIHKPRSFTHGACALARRYGVAETTIRNALSGKNWRHVLSAAEAER